MEALGPIATAENTAVKGSKKQQASSIVIEGMVRDDRSAASFTEGVVER